MSGQTDVGQDAAQDVTQDAVQTQPQAPDYFVHESSYVDEGAFIGAGTRIWHFSHIQSGARIGSDCSFGQNVNVANNVIIGNGCRVQNNVSIYEGVTLEDDVFCGPSCVFTNDFMPRAAFPVSHESYLKTIVRQGASIGANATIVCGTELGQGCLVAAGAVVTRDVPAFALVAGVPARRIGWVCLCGQRLDEQGKLSDEAQTAGEAVCPACGRRYQLSETAGQVTDLALAQES